eukprot:794491_1
MSTQNEPLDYDDFDEPSNRVDVETVDAAVRRKAGPRPRIPIDPWTQPGELEVMAETDLITDINPDKPSATKPIDGHPHAREYKSAKLTARVNSILARTIQLDAVDLAKVKSKLGRQHDPTYQDILGYLVGKSAEMHIFLTGPMIRDLLRGYKNHQIRVSVQGRFDSLFTSGLKELGVSSTFHTTNCNQLSFPAFSTSDDPMDLVQCSLGQTMDSISWSFTSNHLFYDLRKHVLVDPLGVGVKHALHGVLAFPAAGEFAFDSKVDGDRLARMMSWKFRSLKNRRPYTLDDQTKIAIMRNLVDQFNREQKEPARPDPEYDDQQPDRPLARYAREFRLAASGGVMTRAQLTAMVGNDYEIAKAAAEPESKVLRYSKVEFTEQFMALFRDWDTATGPVIVPNDRLKSPTSLGEADNVMQSTSISKKVPSANKHLLERTTRTNGGTKMVYYDKVDYGAKIKVYVFCPNARGFYGIDSTRPLGVWKESVELCVSMPAHGTTLADLRDLIVRQKMAFEQHIVQFLPFPGLKSQPFEAMHSTSLKSLAPSGELSVKAVVYGMCRMEIDCFGRNGRRGL